VREQWSVAPEISRSQKAPAPTSLGPTSESRLTQLGRRRPSAMTGGRTSLSARSSATSPTHVASGHWTRSSISRPEGAGPGRQRAGQGCVPARADGRPSTTEPAGRRTASLITITNPSAKTGEAQVSFAQAGSCRPRTLSSTASRWSTARRDPSRAHQPPRVCISRWGSRRRSVTGTAVRVLRVNRSTAPWSRRARHAEVRICLSSSSLAPPRSGVRRSVPL
jgi:hypothetical protein